MTTLKQKITQLPFALHAVLALLAFIAFRISNIVLDTSYARSLFPVPYQVGQTAFDGQLIKSYYQTMIEAGTLNIYWQTQLIDFAFIASLFALGLLLPLLIRRGFRPKILPYRLATASSILIPLGATFDIIENLISFIMLANPLGFPDPIALVYSSFAVLKFGAIATGYIVTFISLLWLLAATIYSRVRLVAASATATQ